MYISKLTLTPIISKASSVVIDKPSTETASMLIKERLASRYGLQKPVKPKMPKFLRGFVNPQTYVGKAVDTYR